MKVLTQREATAEDIREAGEPMRPNQFGEDWNRRVRAMRAAIASLDPATASPEDIGLIRKANGFSGLGEVLNCDECGERRDRLIRFGEEPDYEARWQDLCAECLTVAAAEARNGN